MNIINHAIKLMAALPVTTSLCVNADSTKQEKECSLNATPTDYDIGRLIKTGTTTEAVFLFAQKASMISPYEIHRFTQLNITPEFVASFHPGAAGEPAFINEILQAVLSPQTANGFGGTL
ncbi:hypothetical protein [Endozoicomonas sp. ISHI1]|uniref:hypothetical protein n=1 Tax=Endozoicomonas sp. ISHI1 TaxID=2825882 RepID=UPI0021482DCC|nr:hypothetical protein [Endozoicomonas sp. ISHI1]